MVQFLDFVVSSLKKMTAAAVRRSYLDPANGFCVPDVRKLIRQRCRFEVPPEDSFPVNLKFPCDVTCSVSGRSVSCEVACESGRLKILGLHPAGLTLGAEGMNSLVLFHWTDHSWKVSIASNYVTHVWYNLKAALHHTGIDLFLSATDFHRVGIQVLDRCASPTGLQLFTMLFARYLVASSFTGVYSGGESCDLDPREPPLLESPPVVERQHCPCSLI